MGNDMVRSIVKSKLDEIYSEVQNISEVNHNFLKGRIREILVESFFKEFLPSNFKCGSGKIIDSKNGQSSEIDLLIYNTELFPPILFSERLGLFPIESCFYAFEIKSKVTSSEIKDSIKKGNSIKRLKSLTGKSENNTPNYISGGNVHRVLFALDSDLKDKSELERYLENDPKGKTNPAINIICVLGKEYVFHDGIKWNISPDTGEKFREIIQFLTGTLNTLPDLLANKKEAYPEFGWYLIDVE